MYVSDLVHTTESLRNAKLAAGKTEKDSRNLDTILEPYKADNARLVKENNDLHLGLLKVKEEKDRISRGRVCVKWLEAHYTVHSWKGLS